MAPDGTEIHIYNQHLYENSDFASKNPPRPIKKKIPRFGKKPGQAKLQFSTGSHKSNMLQPMSDVVSLKGDGLDEMTVQNSMDGTSNWKPPRDRDQDSSNDSSSAMMEFEAAVSKNDAQMEK